MNRRRELRRAESEHAPRRDRHLPKERGSKRIEQHGALVVVAVDTERLADTGVIPIVSDHTGPGPTVHTVPRRFRPTRQSTPDARRPHGRDAPLRRTAW